MGGDLMRSKTLVTLLLAVTVVIAGFAGVNMMRTNATVPVRQILTANMALAAGTLLRGEDMKWHTVTVTEGDHVVRPSGPAVDAKPELVQEAEAALYGAVLRRPIGAGDPIRRGDFVRPGERDFLKLVLLPGSRAISFPVTTGGASTGLLSPGDRVDVILTQNFKHDTGVVSANIPLTRKSLSETVVQNLRVLAIDAVETKPQAGNNNGFGRTVTLEVTPDQAELINVSTELGKLSLTLRGALAAASSADIEPVHPKWAADASPALLGAAQEKPVALAPKTIMVLRGAAGRAGEDLRRENVKPEN
jgi:pilus assembly protein CpaB